MITNRAVLRTRTEGDRMLKRVMSFFNDNEIIKKFAEQILHLLWAALALFPIFFWGPSIATGFLAGILLALPRELVDQWPINKWLDTVFDLTFFGIGGALLGILF